MLNTTRDWEEKDKVAKRGETWRNQGRGSSDGGVREGLVEQGDFGVKTYRSKDVD